MAFSTFYLLRLCPFILSYGWTFGPSRFFFFLVIGVIGFVLCFLWVGLINETCVAILASSWLGWAGLVLLLWLYLIFFSFNFNLMFIYDEL